MSSPLAVSSSRVLSARLEPGLWILRGEVVLSGAALVAGQEFADYCAAVGSATAVTDCAICAVTALLPSRTACAAPIWESDHIEPPR